MKVTVTVKVQITRKMRVRLAIAKVFMAAAAHMLGCNFELETQGEQ